MTEREPSRERFLQLRCEHCGEDMPGPGIYVESDDEFWCDSCIVNRDEAAYDRQQAADVREEQLRTWAEHQKAHKR